MIYGGDIMIIKATSKDRDMLARLMRAEATGEGELGMLMVGNVVANRGISNCLTFKNVRTIPEVVYQSPGGFVGKDSPLFYANPTTKEKQLADRVVRGEYFHPATNALWFYAPASGASCRTTWYDQQHTGRYKNHCFYRPDPGVCIEIH